MSTPYEETLEGKLLVRQAPGERHERVCSRLHELVSASLDGLRSATLLAPRSRIAVAPVTAVCPDLALIATATGRLWLAAEVIHGGDHHADTVLKKQIYEDLRLPRLWMLDTRYDNVEVYHAGPYGLSLKSILAGGEILSEQLLPEFQVSIRALFAA